MQPGDLGAVATLAGRLVRLHHALDPDRFLHLKNPEPGYARWLASEMEQKEVVLLVAELNEPAKVVGYVYARLEPRSYNELLDAHGKIHDVFVDDSARKKGVGEALVRAAIAQLTTMNAPRSVLLTAVKNEAAQRLFQKIGFRTTMLEMTIENEIEPSTGIRSKL